MVLPPCSTAQQSRRLAAICHHVVASNAAAAAGGGYRTATDATIKPADVPTPETKVQLDLEDVTTTGGGAYLPDRVTSPLMKTAVRQEGPAPLGPRYQEALTYTFLVHSMKFPRLTRLDDGRLF